MDSKSVVPSNYGPGSIPGSYGLPVLGSIADQLKFFYFQGETEYFRNKVKEYKSTVFRVNFMPATPFFPDSKGVALMDQKSFPVLFDNEKVSKNNVFIGPYSPNSSFNGGFRPLAYMDTKEDGHRVLKEFVFEVIKSKCRNFLPQLESSFKEWIDKFTETEGGKGDLSTYLEPFSFDFMAKTFGLGGQIDAKIGAQMFKNWIGVQFCPVSPAGASGLPFILENLVLRTFPLPFALASGNYEKICSFLGQATDVLEMGQKQFGLNREEVLHNFAFIFGVNAWLGLSRVFPAVVFRLGSLGTNFQTELGNEIRTAFPDVASASSTFTKAEDSMPLLQSFMLEFFRMEPPVLYQYARARDDFVVESHDAAFLIKKGELLGGSQALVCRDPVVFDDPETFVPGRFLGPEKSHLAKHVFWSNGPHTGTTSTGNKQCAAKDLVWMISKFFVVQLLLRYEKIELKDGANATKFSIKSLTPSKQLAVIFN